MNGEDKNIFGVPRITATKFYSAVGSALQMYEDGLVAEQEAKDALWTLCGSFSRNPQDAYLKYEDLMADFCRNITQEELGNDEIEMCISNGGGLIACIKAYRSFTGLGLKEAKDYVERYLQDNKYGRNCVKLTDGGQPWA